MIELRSKLPGASVNAIWPAAWIIAASNQRDTGKCWPLSEGGGPGEADIYEAFKWFKRAAESGHIKSMHFYGICYFYGEGVAIDKHEGIKWMTRSGEAGYAASQYHTNT
jgi:TPR repeat protein